MGAQSHPQLSLPPFLSVASPQVAQRGFSEQLVDSPVSGLLRDLGEEGAQAGGVGGEGTAKKWVTAQLSLRCPPGQAALIPPKPGVYRRADWKKADKLQKASSSATRGWEGGQNKEEHTVTWVMRPFWASESSNLRILQTWGKIWR